jgi:hypothetical protein
VFLLISILAAHAAVARCPADPAVLSVELASTFQAADQVAWEAFDQGVDRLRGDLGCLCAELPAAELLDVHRVFALDASRRRDRDAAIAAYRAVLVLDAGFEPPYAEAPPGSLLREAWKAAYELGPGPNTPAPAGRWLVDGAPATEGLPLERAAFVQRFEGDGRCGSLYLGAGTASARLGGVFVPPAPAPTPPALSPAWPASGSVAALYPCPAPSRRSLLTGLALAATGLSGIAAAELVENRMMSTDDPQRAQRLYGAAVATSLTGLGVGLSGGALVVAGAASACREGGEL